MHYTFGQMIARASQDVYLFPGDVIGSGTAGSGCILELGPRSTRGSSPGDEVTLEIERARRPDQPYRLIPHEGASCRCYHSLGEIPHKRHTQFRRPTEGSTPSS